MGTVQTRPTRQQEPRQARGGSLTSSSTRTDRELHYPKDQPCSYLASRRQGGEREHAIWASPRGLLVTRTEPWRAPRQSPAVLWHSPNSGSRRGGLGGISGGQGGPWGKAGRRVGRVSSGWGWGGTGGSSNSSLEGRLRTEQSWVSVCNSQGSDPLNLSTWTNTFPTQTPTCLTQPQSCSFGSISQAQMHWSPSPSAPAFSHVPTGSPR